MNKHTPGPWNTIWIDGTHVIDANGGKTDIAHIINRGNPDTTEANARLVAAATDLLEACQAVIDEMEAVFVDTDEMAPEWVAIGNMCREAIAKATGETT